MFAQPEWLLLALLAPVYLLLEYRDRAERRRIAQTLGDPDTIGRLASLAVSPLKLGIRTLSLALAFALAALAAARPQIGAEPVLLKQAGIDLVVAMDLSASMNARDIPPTRFDKARLETVKLVNALDGNRVGLVTFAGEAFLQCPLTLDIAAVRMFLDAISPDVMPVQGTAIAAAIDRAVTAMDKSRAKAKIVVLVTDGEDFEGDALKAAHNAADKGIIIHTVGIGSEKGAPVPVISPNGNIAGYKTDEAGNPVLSRLEPDQLRAIASETGGISLFLSNGSVNFNPLIEAIKNLEKSDIASREFTKYIERFQYPLALAIILISIDLLLPITINPVNTQDSAFLFGGKEKRPKEKP